MTQCLFSSAGLTGRYRSSPHVVKEPRMSTRPFKQRLLLQRSLITVHAETSKAPWFKGTHLTICYKSIWLQANRATAISKDAAPWSAQCQYPLRPLNRLLPLVQRLQVENKERLRRNWDCGAKEWYKICSAMHSLLGVWTTCILQPVIIYKTQPSFCFGGTSLKKGISPNRMPTSAKDYTTSNKWRLPLCRPWHCMYGRSF